MTVRAVLAGVLAPFALALPPAARAQGGAPTAADPAPDTAVADTTPVAAAAAVKDTAILADSVPADSVPTDTATAPTPLQAALGGITLSGYAEASYAYSTAAAPGGPIAGRSFDRLHDEFTLNVLKIVLDRPAPTDQLSAGFRLDLLFGQNAPLLQSAGLNLGTHGDIEQGFVTLNLPTGNGNPIQFKAGKMVTLMGVEVIEDIVNPNWSVGNQFLYAENFTNTGIEVGYRWSPLFDTQFRVFNGWDVVDDNNGRKSFMGRVGITPDSRTALSLVGYLGPEQAGNDDADRKGVELIVNRKVGSLSLWAQGDYGTEDANAALPDPTSDAEWWAAGLWATYDFTSAVGVGLRADYFDDQDGARTSNAPITAPLPANTGNELTSLTATLNVRAWERTLVRPEVRYDHSTVPNAFGDSDDQVTFGVSAAYIF
jgi:hypothetical protein